jgi:hypothetical protein
MVWTALFSTWNFKFQTKDSDALLEWKFFALVIRLGQHSDSFYFQNTILTLYSLRLYIHTYIYIFVILMLEIDVDRKLKDHKMFRGLHDTSNSKNDCPWDSRIQKMAKNESLTIYIPHGCVRGGAWFACLVDWNFVVNNFFFLGGFLQNF